MIGSWYCLPEHELSADTLAAYAADGFTHFQTLDQRDGEWTPYSRDGNLRALDLCAATGLRCFVVDARLYRGQRPYPLTLAPSDADVDAAAADYAGHPALAGYLLYDEPSPHAFPALAGTIARLRQRDPDAVALVPLFPMHDDPRFPDAFEGRAYADYMRDFVQACRPTVLAYDYYPFFDPPRRMPQYRVNFAIAREVAEEAGLPLWFYPAIVAGPPPGLEPTLDRVRFQVNLALAHGARGLFHFTYRSDRRASSDVLRAANREAATLLAVLADLDLLRVDARDDEVVATFSRGGEPTHTLTVAAHPDDDRAARLVEL
jgi:hypothetical protein